MITLTFFFLGAACAYVSCKVEGLFGYFAIMCALISFHFLSEEGGKHD